MEIPRFDGLPRVTSDSKPFRAGGRLFVCRSCGLTQKTPDSSWLKEIEEIYRDYEMYHQSASDDQAVFDPVTGKPSGRCEVLARRLFETGVLPSSGTLLDVGAGSGAMLAAVSAASHAWHLYGLDLDTRKERSLKAIPGFEKLFTVAPEALTQDFELITLIHSLEHFTAPKSMLQSLKKKVASGGKLFVEVNNAEKTPFDLIVADHLCHFTPDSLAYLLKTSGLSIESINTDWVNKEISLLAALDGQPTATPRDDPEEVVARVNEEVGWLASMLSHARKQIGDRKFGIFGTSVAATWLAGHLGDGVEFFVDEDPARDGRTHLGRPILRPNQVPAGATIYLAFVPQVSQAISRRLGPSNFTFATPPKAP